MAPEKVYILEKKKVFYVAREVKNEDKKNCWSRGKGKIGRRKLAVIAAWCWGAGLGRTRKRKLVCSREK